MSLPELIAERMIGIGILIMTRSVISHIANIYYSYDLFYKSSKIIHKLSEFHLVLMIFFLIGYLVL